ncbi:MAG TPA: NAD(P)-binding domain-containing protein, partial [Methanocorpusculum sp.]|nr:NAD(P)-binding domain-containing protein [Methanocorpusculum sp.]
MNVSVKIGIIGGTGDIGKGLALRISDKHEIILGSREASKACEAADATVCTLREHNTVSLCRGASNEEAVRDADIVVISV